MQKAINDNFFSEKDFLAYKAREIIESVENPDALSASSMDCSILKGGTCPFLRGIIESLKPPT